MMEFSADELEVESLQLQPSDIRLSSSAVKCDICKIGKVVSVGREANLVIYTRSGTYRGVHVEKRCNNRSTPCRARHYYGFVTTGSTKHIDEDALRQEFLITSNQTAFSVDYMWDITLQVLFSRASFEGLGQIFNNLHFTNLPDDVLQRRENVFAKRISEAFYKYAYIEIGQRYDIEMTLPHTLDEAILTNKSSLHDVYRTIWTQRHHCDVAGCGSVITMDGGLKPHRKLCASKLAGVREFQSTGIKVVSGCTSIPLPKSKFCREHQFSQSPALLSSQVSKTTRMSLRDHRVSTAASVDASQDNIYVIETILGVKTKEDTLQYQVKWLKFPTSESTWEPEDAIPGFIRLFFKNGDNFGKPLPNPRLKRLKRAGSDVYHLLSWDSENTVDEWVHDDFFKLLGDDGEVYSALEDDNTCNTRKSRDKISRRHTVGILVGAFPCGTITLFEELYGSESLSQVYAIMIEYLAGLPKLTRENIIEICYDDACHFKKYSENEKRSNLNETTKFMAGLGKHVDKFHFPNHVDSWCHANCNPQDVRHLDGVNTPVCEQLFSAINKYTNAKAMNEAHFFLFFLYIFDLHNLDIEKKLRSVANPRSEYRYEVIKDAKRRKNDLTDVLINELERLVVKDNYVEDNHSIEKAAEDNPIVDLVMDPVAEPQKKSEFSCEHCSAQPYKRAGMLALHMKTKHPDIVNEPHKCKVCGKLFENDENLKEHMLDHCRCTLCDIPFDDVKYLNRHIKVNHSPIACKICDKECSDKEALDVHLKEHLKCSVCGKVFDMPYKLKRHMKSHE